MHDYHPNRLIQSHQDTFAYIGRTIVNIMANIRTTQESAVINNGQLLHPLLRIKLNQHCRKVDGGSKGLKERKIKIVTSEKDETRFWISIEGLPYRIHVVAGQPTWKKDRRRKYAQPVTEITGQEEFELGAVAPVGKMFIEVCPTPDPFECQVNLTLMTNRNQSSSRAHEEIIGTERIDELELQVMSKPYEEHRDENEFRNIMKPRDNQAETYDADTEQKEIQNHEQDIRKGEGSA